MKKYIGITIGPIVDTIMEASTPAALWFSSSVFSDLTRRLCEAILEEFPDTQIYSPYYSKEVQLDDGVGKFHDRILFSTSGFDKEKMKDIIENSKMDTLGAFSKNIVNEEGKRFLKQYIQIHYIVIDEKDINEKNCIEPLSSKLDVLELMKSFPNNNRNNIFKKLFAGERNNTNVFIKESSLFNNIRDDNNQFFNSDKKSERNIRTIDEIASDNNQINKNKKSKYYYAVVQADGDDMGNYLKNLSDDLVTVFSKACLNYDEKAAEKIGNFGGMTIYAGGDDLLFLAPVVNNKGETIFGLCQEIDKLFREELKKQNELKGFNDLPTISFGISIQYRKFPLYEALQKARQLLFDDAKNDNINAISGEKNKMVIHLQKHSGQSVKLFVSNDSCEILEKFLELGKDNEVIITSILYHLRNFERIFTLSSQNKNDKNRYISVWKNMFDGEEQKKAWSYIEKIADLFYVNFICERKAKIETIYETGKYIIENESIKTLITILQFKKFLEEKGGEE